jgi:putative glycosyltransferase (TIGR04348 family)
MDIAIVTPAPPNSRSGNRVTALRWARILRSLGHRVIISESYTDGVFDLLIALHARRSYASVSRFHRLHPRAALIVALTGTDLYRDLLRSRNAQRALEIATRIVLLQPKALDELRSVWRRKARVVYQSVVPFGKTPGRRAARNFDVCVVGHLRAVKDPFRAAMASRQLPKTSRIRIVHLGKSLSESTDERARREMMLNPRYKWLGEVSSARVRRVMSQSRLFVISSKMEGGANALGEAIVAGLPVLASRIAGAIGILGEDYPGYFEVGDANQLARLLSRCETDAEFLSDLTTRCRNLAGLFDPALEERVWRELLEEVSGRIGAAGRQEG